MISQTTLNSWLLVFCVLGALIIDVVPVLFVPSYHTDTVSQVDARIGRVIFTSTFHLETKSHHPHESFIYGLVSCFSGLRLIVMLSVCC